MSAEETRGTEDNADWGTTGVTRACDVFDLRNVSTEPEYELVDAVATRRAQLGRDDRDVLHPVFQFSDPVREGDTIEVKVAQIRVADSGSTRRGRFRIPREQAEEADGFALGVYERDEGILAMAVLPAEDVVDRVTWWDCDGRYAQGEFATPSWAEFFDPEEVEDRA